MFLGGELTEVGLVEEIVAFLLFQPSFVLHFQFHLVILSEILRSIKLSRFVLNK